MGGVAGCLAALLVLQRTAPNPTVLEMAARCGERLLAAAQQMTAGLGWPAPSGNRVPLTGFAHGSAGFAWALGQLAATTHDSRFATGARGALEFERSLYSTVARNWPDLRGGAEADGRPRFMVAWCHGAAGIGLARLASRPWLDDACVAREVQVALQTTLERGLGLGHALCHGDLGNLDLLVCMTAASGEQRWLQEARRCAAGIIADAHETGWLCATPFGLESPGLMTGLAGIGYGLLRLAAPESIPSVLSLAQPVSRVIKNS